MSTKPTPVPAAPVAAELGVTPEVARKLLKVREACANSDINDAWYWLTKIADPEIESLTPWAKLEAAAALESIPATAAEEEE